MEDIGLEFIDAKPGRTPLRAKFFVKPIPRTIFENDPSTGQRRERLVHENREYVEVVFPGGKEKPHFRVNDEIKAMFPKTYAAFKAGQSEMIEGTPVDMLPYLTPADVANLKAAQVLSEEQLSALPDSVIGQIGMNGRELRAKAQARLKAIDSSAGTLAAASEINNLKELLEAQSAELAEMRKKLNAPVRK